MKDVLMICHYCTSPDEKGNLSFTYIAELLTKYGYHVELVTTGFSHSKKKMRSPSSSQIDSLPYKFTMIFEPGYKKNISFKRIFSHYIFGLNLSKYLDSRKKPDIIYCGVPSLDAGKAAVKYAKKENIPLIIDLQDLWPEAYKMVFKVPIFNNIVFKPMERAANYIYSNADKVIAVSDTFAKRALSVNTKTNDSLTVYLGTDLSKFDSLALKKQVQKPQGELWLIYVGTLGHSYNIPIVIDALSLLQERGYNNLRFKVLGDGPLKESFEKYAERKKVKADFLGRLGYEEMISYLVASDIAVNPIANGSAASIINKVADYAAAGLPVLNTQECQEYRDMVDKHKIGLNCSNSDANSLVENILLLINNRRLALELGQNNRKLAEDRFDRNITYLNIVHLVGNTLNI